MAATFIAKSTLSSGNASPHSQSYMGGIVAGDLLLLVLFTNQNFGGAAGTASTPAGWTLATGGSGYRNASLATVGSIACFYKIADGSEAGSVSVTIDGSLGGSNVILSQMYQYRNAPPPLLEGASTNITGDGASTIVGNAVSVSGNARTLIQFTGQNDNAPGTPSGYTSRATDASGGIVSHLHCDDKADVGADGATSASGGDAAGWATIHLSFYSASGRSFIVP